MPGARLQRAPFDLAAAARAVRTPACGAVVLYVGTVRRTPAGGGRKRVVRLEYEAFDKMALAKLREVRRDAMDKFGVERLLIHHRIGNFDVGEDVVLCAAAAPHRSEAVGAVSFSIAQMKQTVPIWKKEVYSDGSQRWVVGEMRVKEVVARQSGKRRPRAG
jgi:molybdopterin synthase catalytic subunit